MDRFTVEDVDVAIDRLYRDDQGRWYPSVSTVLDVRPMPDALANWLANTDDAEAVNRYKRNRGTIAHYECLNPLYQASVGDEEADMWGDDEATSKATLQEDGRWRDTEADVGWVQETFGLIRELFNIDHILSVETYTKHEDIQVAGQFDVLYYDQELAETVLADLKTGKYVYEESKDQIACYAHCVDRQVDRAEIIRMSPDYEDWEVSSSHDWERTLEQCWADYRATRKQFADEYDLEETVERLEELIDAGELVPDSERPG